MISYKRVIIFRVLWK